MSHKNPKRVIGIAACLVLLAYPYVLTRSATWPSGDPAPQLETIASAWGEAEVTDLKAGGSTGIPPLDAATRSGDTLQVRAATFPPGDAGRRVHAGSVQFRNPVLAAEFEFWHGPRMPHNLLPADWSLGAIFEVPVRHGHAIGACVSDACDWAVMRREGSYEWWLYAKNATRAEFDGLLARWGC